MIKILLYEECYVMGSPCILSEKQRFLLRKLVACTRDASNGWFDS